MHMNQHTKRISLFRQQKGFTLIELLVVIVVIALTASIALPALQTQMAKNRLNTTAREFADVFVTARGQAAALHRDITIKLECPKNKQQVEECEADTATTLHWVSKNSDIQLLSDKMDVTYTAVGLAKQRTKMVTNPDFDEEKDEDSSNPKQIAKLVPLEFELCDTELGESKTIHISMTGTVERIVKGTC